MFKVNHKDTSMTPGVFIVNFEHTLHLVLVILLLTLNIFNFRLGIKIFNDSINFDIFPENAKIARLTPIFQLGKTEVLKNHRPISLLSCFSKILDQVMYNRLYKYLGKNNLLFQKQFGFREGHCTNHTPVEPISNIFVLSIKIYVL